MELGAGKQVQVHKEVIRVKLRMHVAILANIMGLLFGITLWSMLSGLVYMGLVLGIIMFIVGNVYGLYISRRVDSAIIEYFMDLFNSILENLK